MEKHFCVSVYVINPKDMKFLLINHKKLGRWVQPGGHIELNEDSEEAAIRETFEETGIKVKLIGERIPREQDFIKPLALQKNIINPDHIHIDIVYMAIPVKADILVNNKRESYGINWFSINEIMDKNFKTFDDVKIWCTEIIKNMSEFINSLVDN